MKLTPAAVEHLLDRWPVARLATLGADGGPELVPVVFARCGERLWSAIDGKPKASTALARLENVRRDPRVSLLLDAYETDWSRLWWLRIAGHASVITRANADSEATIEAAALALRDKYPQYGETLVFRGEPTLLSIEIRSLKSWCASPEALARAGESPAPRVRS